MVSFGNEHYKKHLLNATPMGCIHIPQEVANVSDDFNPGPDFNKCYKYFTGNGLEHVWICGDCWDNDIDIKAISFHKISEDMFEELDDAYDYTQGMPEILSGNNLDMKFSTKTIDLSTRVKTERYLIRATVPTSDKNQYLLILENKLLGRLLGERIFLEILRLDVSKEIIVSRLSCENVGHVNLSKLVEADLSADGKYLALYNPLDRFGVVYEYPTMEIKLYLDRKDYHTDVSVYPLGFFEYNDRTLLYHGTDWNRIDVSDPATGELLTDRAQVDHKDQNYNDYFYGRTSISPDAKWLVSSGWVWHPWGSTLLWNIERWLTDNVWEPENASLLHGSEDWDNTMVWLNDELVAIGGYLFEEYQLTGVVIYNVKTAREAGWFPGPKFHLYIDKLLFSSDAENEMEVWNPWTGELITKLEFKSPSCHHVLSKQFLNHDDNFQLNVLRYDIAGISLPKTS